jgi:transcription-repair coupling factor (superfamily II helicase)
MSPLLHTVAPSSTVRNLRWHQLYGSAAALALAETMRGDQRLYVVIADGARELERLTAELRFFGSDQLILLRLPDWEVLPYDLFSPHPDIISERLQTLFELPQVNTAASSSQPTRSRSVCRRAIMCRAAHSSCAAASHSRSSLSANASRRPATRA